MARLREAAGCTLKSAGESPAWLMITEMRLACVLQQLSCNPLAFCLDRGHSIDKSLDFTGKILVAILRKVVRDSAPATFDLAPCFHKGACAGFDAIAPFEQFDGDGFDLCTNECRIAAKVRAVDSVQLARACFSTDVPLGSVRRDTERPQLPREFESPPPQGLLANVQTLSLFAHGFDQDMHVRVRFISVERHCVSVL